MSEWRVGHKIPRNLYQGDDDIGRMDTAELAETVVRAVNLVHHTAGDFLTANDELGAEVVRLRAQIDADTDEMAADAHHAVGLELAVARVRELHSPVRLRGAAVEVCHHCGLLEFGGEYDEALWPCKTIQALDGEA